MDTFGRGIVVPFFAILFPLLWYVNRNLTTDVLPPTVEPSFGLIAAGIAVAVVGAAVGAAITSMLLRRYDGESASTSRVRRVFVPPPRALRLFLGCMAVIGVIAAILFSGGGPEWLRTVLLVAVVPFVVPFVLLAPLAIHSHLATILGLVCIPLWCSLVSTLVAGFDR